MEKILVIDDEEANVRVLSMSLKLDGYDVLGAYSGEEGLALFKEEAPDIVLTDIKMPGMNGLEVLKQVKDLNPESEVIIITGHGDIDSAIEALQYGASDFINKPVKDEALAIALKRAREKLAIRKQLKAYTDDLENMVQIATEEIKRKSNFQTKLITSSNDGIVATDENMRILIFNPGAERIFGYTRLEVVNRLTIHELLPEALRAMLGGDAAGTGPVHEIPWTETVIRDKEQARIPVRFSWKILFEKGKVMGSVAFFQDLREIKRLESELLKNERLAAIGQTVAGMAHCIKNILYGFKGGSYLVDIGLNRDDIPKLRSGWQMIQRNIGRTSDLVLDLLSFSKEREPEYKDCRPNEIADDVCELLKGRATENEIKIDKEFDPSIGTVAMDERSIHRVLMNLMSNAIDACKFDENTAKEWRVRLKTVHEKGEQSIRFEVQDNGCGMDEDVQKRLFTSFFSTKGPQGTGLGMLVTHKLIKEHRGSIDIVSQAGQGTTVTVRLPFKSEEESRPRIGVTSQ